MKRSYFLFMLGLILTGCSAVNTEISDSINNKINNDKAVSKYISGEVEYSHNTSLENDGYSYEKFDVYAKANEEFNNLPNYEKYNVLEKIASIIKNITSDDYTFDCGEKMVCAYSSVRFTYKDDIYSFDSLDVNDVLELRYDGNVVYSKESDSKTTSGTTEDDSSSDSSPYTDEELKSDPTAPSDNPADYNKDGEYVPSDGQSDNPADYNANGEYKPVEDMTKEEIQQELEEMLGN